MLTLIGSSIIPAIGITSIWLIGYRRWRRVGWYLGLLNQAIWIVYAALTAQYGFIAGALIAAGGYMNALHRTERNPAPAPSGAASSHNEKGIAHVHPHRSLRAGRRRTRRAG